MTALEIGSARPLLVRDETIRGTGGREWRLLYASDLHLTARRSHLIAQLCEAAAGTRPHAVLLGGDLLDRRNGARVLERCVARLRDVARVYAVPGNHDARVGTSLVRRAVVAGGGRWLPDGDGRCSADGHRPLRLLARPAGGTGLRVVVSHYPDVFPRAAATGCSVVLAGHLHGGQCVLWDYRGRQYPGAFHSRWNGLRFEQGGSTLLVSRGVADTLPVRFRCPREVLLCRIR